MSDIAPLKATPERLKRLAGEGYLNAENLENALRWIGALPNLERWRQFLDYLLLVLGVALGVTGIFFFFAYNWNGLSRFAKLGLLETLVALCALAALRMRLQGHPAQMALVAAALLTGGLLAVHGQIYQTGADFYLLFALWTLLITGWVLISQYTLLWFIWLALGNLSLILFWAQRMPDETNTILFMILALLNGLALSGWEWGKRYLSWLGTRWTPRLIGLAAVINLTIPAVEWLLHQEKALLSLNLAAGLYLLGISVLILFYSRLQHDLFLLAISLFSLVTCLTVALGVRLDFSEATSWLLIGVALIVESGVAITTLRQIANTWGENV